MSLTIRKPWTSQPQLPAVVDWGNPLLESVDFVLLGSQRFYNPQNKIITRVGAATSSLSISGVGSVVTKTDYFSYPAQVGTGGTSPWTIAGVFTPITLPTAWAAVGDAVAGYCDSPGNNTQDRAVSLANTTNQWSGYLFDGAQKTSISSAVATVGKSDAVVVTVDNLNLICAVAGAAESSTAVGNNGYNGYAGNAVFCAGNADFQNIGSMGIQLLVRTNASWNTTKRASFLANPWKIFTPLRRTFSPFNIAVTIARPGSDITTTGWTGVPDNTNKYANIDEASASDTDYIQSPTVSGTVAPIIFGIVDQGGGANTLPVGTWDVHVRATYIDGLTASQVRVTLLDSGGTSVGASSWQTVTSSFATYTLSITTTGIAARIKVEVQ
jgi:hypothetical protein